MKDSFSHSSSLSLLADVCLGSALGPEMPALATGEGGLALGNIRKEEVWDTEEVKPFLFAFEHGTELAEVVLGCYVARTQSGGCYSEMLEGRLDHYTYGMIWPPPSAGVCVFAAASSFPSLRPVM